MRESLGGQKRKKYQLSFTLLNFVKPATWKEAVLFILERWIYLWGRRGAILNAQIFATAIKVTSRMNVMNIRAGRKEGKKMTEAEFVRCRGSEEIDDIIGRAYGKNNQEEIRYIVGRSKRIGL